MLEFLNADILSEKIIRLDLLDRRWELLLLLSRGSRSSSSKFRLIMSYARRDELSSIQNLF
jgi:hypothetical protein